MEIYKQKINVLEETVFEAHTDKILTVELQHGGPVVYYINDRHKFPRPMKIHVWGAETGQSIYHHSGDYINDPTYIKTLLYYGDNYVVHYFYDIQGIF